MVVRVAWVLSLADEVDVALEGRRDGLEYPSTLNGSRSRVKSRGGHR